MSVLETCRELGIEIPTSRTPSGTFAPLVRVGELVFTSGQTAKVDGVVRYAGKLGCDVSIEEGQKAAKICALNCLALLNDHAGGLDRIERIVRLTGYVNSTEDFTKQGMVIEAASKLLHQIFGEKGLHARTSIGVAALPGDSACEIELVAQVK